MFPFFNVAQPGQLSSTRFKYFTSFFRAVPDVELSIMFIFKPSIARQRINIRHYVYCLTVVWTISRLVAGVSLLHVQFYLRFRYTRCPHWRCLHADSITRAIHMMYFPRCFHYLRNPYPKMTTILTVSLHAH